jgi:Right handed beta helix region
MTELHRILLTIKCLGRNTPFLNTEIQYILPENNNGMKKLIITTLLLSIFFDSIAQHKYYFANHLNSGSGTIQFPFTISENLDGIQFQPGDSVFFNGSDTLISNITLSDIHGNKNHPVVFTSYGDGISTLDGKDSCSITLQNSGFVNIINLRLLGSGRKTGNTKDGLRLVNCENIKLYGLDISGFQKSGLFLYDCQEIDIEKIRAYDNGATGILVEGTFQKRITDQIRIHHCSAENNAGDPTNLDNHSGNGILVGNCKNVVIEYCTATNNGWDMPRIGNGPVGIWAYEADSVLIQHCLSYRNKTATGAADGGGFDLDGDVTNSIIQYCLSYENWGSGYGVYQYSGASNWYNNTVRYCISINDGMITDKASGMLIWNGYGGDSTFTNFYAYNNFLYNDQKYAFGFHPLSRHREFYFFNNIFVSSDTNDIFMNLDRCTSDKFLGNVWMKVNGGFSQDGFNNFRQWAKSTDHEMINGSHTGTTFRKRIFNLHKPIYIIDPVNLYHNAHLRFLFNRGLRNKGINLKKLFNINPGERDFFNNPVPLGKNFEPGVCEIR